MSELRDLAPPVMTGGADLHGTVQAAARQEIEHLTAAQLLAEDHVS